MRHASVGGEGGDGDMACYGCDDDGDWLMVTPFPCSKTDLTRMMARNGILVYLKQ